MAAQQNNKYGLNAQPSTGDVGASPAANAVAGSSSSAPPTTSPSDLVRVDFYFDVLSPYSYFAFELLLRYRGAWGLDLRLKPVFQGALISSTGNTPPAFNAAKGPYLTKDVQRQARYFEVPLAKFPPSRFQDVLTGSIAVQRMLVAVSVAHPDRPALLERVTRNVWQRHFGRDEDILSTESKIAALTDGTGLTLGEAQSLIDASTSPAVKAALTANTAEALAHGGFGVPLMVFPVSPAGALPGVDPAGERAMLFGSDRFHVMAQMLQKEFTGPRPAGDAAAGKKRKITSRL